ncbi:MAG: quinol:cytochrome C oxidoreductase [Cytophagaceae bacterium]
MVVEEKFEFTGKAKTSLVITFVVGVILALIGVFLIGSGGHGHEAHEAAGHGAHHGGIGLRVIKNLWHNNVFFTGIAVIGIFFVAFNYVAWAGWSAAVKRVPEAFGYYLFFALISTVVIFALFHHELFHWWEPTLYEKGHENYDPIIASKTWYLGKGFFTFRMVAYFVIWIGLWWILRTNSIKEDLEGGVKYHDSSVFWSAIFLIFWGVTSSTSAWDWVMSVDPHFFSTMFGWYVFASWFVTGLAVITFTVVLLKENGYLPMVNENHLHDLGKFVFAFSVFWTYIWFCQFLLIYYANIPEESYYFVERLKTDVYSPIFFMNIFINFFFPFLALMTRNAKRQRIILKIVCVAVFIGHWFDFYIMLTPPILRHEGGLDGNFFFLELGIALTFLSIFIFSLMFGLTKASLVAKNHPMLEESVHHHVY